MPVPRLHGQVRSFLKSHLDGISETTLERVTLLVVGIIGARSAAPARVASALRKLGLSGAKAESIERRVRRIENDPEVTATLCFHLLAQMRLCLERPTELLLILDPTTQDERVVMLSASIRYRGRALPLIWATWPANVIDRTSMYQA